MELDRQWTWQKKKLACRIRPEHGNPAGDNLREMFAELAGVDLNELLNEMKQTKKKKEATDKVTTDFEAEKKFKEVLSRSRILGASSQALNRMEEYDKIKATTVTQKNVKKVYTVLPKSPPKRVMVEIQRERAKPLRLPDQDEHKIATNKLEKKLAKQRAARMAAIEQSAKNEEAMKKASNAAEFFVNTLNDARVFGHYGGDLFSTGGHYLEGMLYLSRMADSSLRTKRLDSASGDFDKKKMDESQSSQDNDKKTDKSTTGADSEEGSTGDHSSNPDSNAKLQCAASLCNWSRNAANAQRLASEGAVRAIMQLSLEPIHRIVQYCAAAFRYMSEFPALGISMIEDGAITTISELISSHTDEFIAYNLAIALVNLTRINGKEGQVVEAAIVLALMNLIMIKPELGSTCVRGLYNLTCVDVSYPSIERVIRALVSLSLSGSANVKHLCAAALCNLSDLKSVRARMVEEGAINVLSTLSRGAETRTRRICAVILQNLSAAKSVRVEMASRNSVAAAYGLSSDQDPIILRCIGLTLSRLSMEPTNCQRIIHEGGIAALCNIAVKYPTIPGITQPVASAFQLLSSNQPYRVNMVNEGSVTAIASLLRSSVDMFTLQHSLLALCNLLCEGENHLPIIQQGLILTLITMCSNENDLLKDFCSLAFLNLSCTEDSRKHLVNAGAVAAIISIAMQNSAVTKKRCAATLCNLSYYSAGMGRMVSDGIIPLIVDLVLAKDIVTVHYSCAALCRLCSTMENAKLILDSGAVPNLVQGAIDGDDTTKQFCGSVLSSLSFYEYCRIPLVELGAIKALKGLALLNDDITKQRCLVAFANLSCEVSVQLKMIEEGVVNIIAELANSYQEINYICCAKAICNLACCETTKSQVAKEGGVLALMMISMVQSVDRLTKLLCVLGLNNLLDESTVDFMVGEGLVGSIGNLSKIGDAHISNLCSKIFNSLSKYDVARAKMVERNATMHALFKLCESTAAETRSTATRTCCNLVFDFGIRHAVVKAGVLGPLEKGIDSEDEEASFQCLAALFCLCSESTFMEQIAKTTIPSTLLKLALRKETPEIRYDLALKVLASLAYDKRSRFYMQTSQIMSMLSALVKENFIQSCGIWIASTFSFLICGYGKIDELVDMGIISTLTFFHTTFNGDRNEDESGVVYKALVECFRILSELKSGLNELANNSILQLFKKAMYYIAPIADGERSSPLISKNDGISAFYNLVVVLYRFANNETGLRITTGTFDTSALIEKLLAYQRTVDVACIALGMYLMDTKSRGPFIKPAIAVAMKNVLNFKISENTLSNLVIAMYAISKVASAREFLTAPSVQLDRVLIQLSGSESPKIKANVNRAYKNLNADLNEAIEEGAVANLIAMSLEGKLKNQSSDEFVHPTLEDDDTLLDPLRDFDSSILMDSWYAKVTVTKGGAAGKGPEPPEPPAMSTDGSAQYPNMMEELDGGEADGKTKMSFAKMQIPTSMKDQHIMTDSDFLFNVDKVEVPLMEEDNGGDSINGQQSEELEQDSEVKLLDQREPSRESHHRTSSFRASRASSMRNISRSSLNGVVEENSDSKGGETPDGDRKRLSKKNPISPNPGSPSPDAIRKARKTKVVKDPSGSSMSEQAQKLGLYS